MRITNTLGLPQPIVEAVRNDGYSRGNSDISVTQLISPPQQVTLIEAHADEIEEDASDRIWSLLGQTVHTILERSEQLMLAEKRLFMDVLGWRVSGATDRIALMETTSISGKVAVKVQDYKVATAWSLALEPTGYKIDWEQQLNLLAHLMRVNGYNPQALEIVTLLRDWSKPQARKDPKGYPQHQVQAIPIPLWSHHKAQAYLGERVRVHQSARERFRDGRDLPECTPAERWMRPTVYAVMKEGRKGAVKLFDDEGAASVFMAEKKGKHSIEVRPGEAVRCAKYCAAAPFCKQYESWSRAP